MGEWYSCDAVCTAIGKWKDTAAVVGALLGVPGALIAIWKARRQRDSELRLKRTEFTLAHHRRLLEDPDIAQILPMIEQDSAQLATPGIWAAKRKFVTFIEELALLVRSGYANEEAAMYMFGYYAKRAYEGANFKDGFVTQQHPEWNPKFWGLFIEFARKSTDYLAGPVDLTHLKL